MSDERDYSPPEVHETGWRPFPNRPTDESAYRYPHEYKIQFRTHDRFTQQRHVWRWIGEGSKVDTDEWIRTLEAPERILRMPLAVS